LAVAVVEVVAIKQEAVHLLPAAAVAVVHLGPRLFLPHLIWVRLKPILSALLALPVLLRAMVGKAATARLARVQSKSSDTAAAVALKETR